ncbi:MAG TPA: BamA/TamA family outer membrane protein [Kofleriaceae bacterium]|nr:BamA/TamA family outer membrane protein [Kofleriaceae bacterium]
MRILVAIALLCAGPAAAAPTPALASPAPAPASPAPAATPAPAAPAAAAPAPRRPIVGFRVRGPSKLTARTLGYLARVSLGDLVGAADLPRIKQALVSSELFERVDVALEAASGGVLLVATLDDKHSWIIAPTLFALPGRRSIGVGFAENNFRGENKKLLIYGQLGDRESLLFGTYLDPRVRGTQLILRGDIFLYRRINEEYANPAGAPTDDRIARSSTATYLGGGLLAGWQHRWWLSTDVRLRGARVTFRDGRYGDDPDIAVPVPQSDGWDVSAQWRATLDRRGHRRGVTWGPYVQLMLDTTIPGLDDYDYTAAQLRAYYSWRFFAEHQLELRLIGNVGYHLPFHEDTSLGGASDLRGYAVDRYRGDTRLVYRAEYSVPLVKWRSFALRGIGFWDSGSIGFVFPRPGDDRDYLPSQLGTVFARTDVGAGLRVYVGAVVLPLLGLDFAYGVEGRSTEIVFELGLTDF